jgi:MFS transporter, DHA1 family, tetracycline resistance protein
VPFYVAGVLASINAIAAMVRMPETRRDVDRHIEGVHIPHAPILRRLAVVGFITVFAFTAFEATFSLFGQRRFDLTESGTSVVFLSIGLVLVVMQGGVYGRLAARTGAGRLYLVAVVLIAAGLGLTGAATRWPVLIVALLLLALGQGMANPAITTLVTEHASPQRRGEALGFQQSAYGVARILGPPAAGAMFDHTGIWSPYVAAAGLCALGALLITGWGIERPRVADAPVDRAAHPV